MTRRAPTLPQAHGTRRPVAWALTLAGAAMLLASLPTMVAAQASGGKTTSITPVVSVTETLTDNARLSATHKVSDAITQLTAALRATARTGTLQGSLDYTLDATASARDTGNPNGRSQLQNTLAATGGLELIDDWLRLDGQVQVGQQTVSAFGLQSTDPLGRNPNRTEVRSARISPSIRGHIGPWLNYQVQATHSATRTDAPSELGNADTNSAAVTLSGRQHAGLGWTVLMSTERTDHRGGRSVDADSARLVLDYVASPELKLSGSTGRESSNLGTINPVTTTSWGVGLDWSPSNRTQVSAKRDHRYFGDSYLLTVSHRLPQSVFRISATRDLSTSSLSASSSGYSSAYDLLFGQLAAVEPDPVRRDQLVRSQLATLGLSSGAGSAGFLSSAATIQRRVDVSLATQGIRTTMVVSAGWTSSSRLDALSSAADDLEDGHGVQQRVVGLAINHRLTPLTGISFDLTRQDTHGGGPALSNSLRTAKLMLTTALGRRVSASLTARHTVFDSPTVPYTENSLAATVGLRF